MPTTTTTRHPLSATRLRIGKIADQSEIERVEQKLAHPTGVGVLATLEEEVCAVLDTDYVNLCGGNTIAAARVREARLADIAMEAVTMWQKAMVEEIENARD